MADAFERRMFNNQMRTDGVGRFSRALQSGQGGTNTNYGRSPHVRGTLDFNRPDATARFNAEYGAGGTNKTPPTQPASQPVKPNPYAAKPTGRLTTPRGPNPLEYVKNLMGLTSLTTAGAVAMPLVLGGSEDASRKWSRLGYSSPEAYQKAISENANRERPLSSDNSVPSPTNNKPNNASEINARLAQQRKEKKLLLL